MRVLGKKSNFRVYTAGQFVGGQFTISIARVLIFSSSDRKQVPFEPIPTAPRSDPVYQTGFALPVDGATAGCTNPASTKLRALRLSPIIALIEGQLW